MALNEFDFAAWDRATSAAIAAERDRLYQEVLALRAELAKLKNERPAQTARQPAEPRP